jgi:uncharacterized protein YndB with AHSA1/START domain
VKPALRPDQPADSAACKAATGRSFEEWFAILDAFGGVAKGRREINGLLYVEHKVDPWWLATINVEYEAARGVRDKDGRPKGYTICATKTVKAAPDACWAAMATPAALDRWLGPGHRGAVADGATLENADGNLATVKKANPGKAIRLVWQQPDAAPGTPVEIKLSPAGAKTTVMVTHDRLQTRAEADGFRRAWGEALDRLRPVIEGTK